MDCSPPGSSVNGILQARVLVGCHALLQLPVYETRFLTSIILGDIPRAIAPLGPFFSPDPLAGPYAPCLFINRGKYLQGSEKYQLRFTDVLLS